MFDSSIELSVRGKAASLAVCLLISLPMHGSAATVGVNPPAQSLTAERVALLPRAERAQWLAYLTRSNEQRQRDKEQLQSELQRAGFKVPIEPPHSGAARSIPLDRADSWYGTAEARHIADVIVSFQTPAGGWGKNLDMSKDVRRAGEAYTPNNLSHFLSADDFDAPREPEWNYVGTIDNDATTTELKFLGKTIASMPENESAKYRACFLRGMEYLFAAQYPNGGWPQVWPLEGGYHDAITYNDDAMVQVMELMHDVGAGTGEYSFVPKAVRVQANASFSRAIQCILRTQIVANGIRTAWPQQEDPLTLQPVSARNFEPPANCAPESAAILLLLMKDLPQPTSEEQAAIRSAAAWLKKTAIYGERWGGTAHGRDLQFDPGAGPIWARYEQIGTDKPIFGDRDKSIHDNVEELSRERRNGYAWYSSAPLLALDRYAEWVKQHPETR